MVERGPASGADVGSAELAPGSIYHLALRNEWDSAVETGEYTGSTLGKSLADEGFIHCSFAGQVDAIARLLYRGHHDVLLLVIDTSRVASPVRVERLEGSEQAFPHIYGPLPVSAVVRVAPIPLEADGRLHLDELLSDES
jgi:glutathione S-transferase